MTTRRNIVAVCFVFCFISSLASADSVNNIPITGTASQGFATTEGDFNITGPSLSLYQGLPGGPSFIGFCNLGSACNFSFDIDASGSAFCICSLYDLGSLGNKVAELFDTSLTFTGPTEVYSGGTSISVPMTVSGTIVGYQLINCQSSEGCSLGPVVFKLHIAGTGTGIFTMNPISGTDDGQHCGGVEHLHRHCYGGDSGADLSGINGHRANGNFDQENSITQNKHSRAGIHSTLRAHQRI